MSVPFLKHNQKFKSLAYFIAVVPKGNMNGFWNFWCQSDRLPECQSLSEIWQKNLIFVFRFLNSYHFFFDLIWPLPEQQRTSWSSLAKKTYNFFRFVPLLTLVWTFFSPNSTDLVFNALTIVRIDQKFCYCAMNII